jgi:REP element-mobilizing transposase RayT
MLAINSMPDHLHMFFGMRPTQSISDLMREVKHESSEWINKHHLVLNKFRWQDGYGAFSYRKKDVPRLINYIRNQETHHQNLIFRNEYRDLLKEFEIDFDENYIFHDPV